MGPPWPICCCTAPDGLSDGRSTITTDAVNAAITRVGHHETGHLPVLDPGSGASTTLVVAWQHVAAAVVLGADHTDAGERPTAGSTGQYR